MRKIGISLCGWLVVMGLWGSPVLAQKRSVAEEILDILRAEHQTNHHRRSAAVAIGATSSV